MLKEGVVVERSDPTSYVIQMEERCFGIGHIKATHHCCLCVLFGRNGREAGAPPTLPFKYTPLFFCLHKFTSVKNVMMHVHILL